MLGYHVPSPDEALLISGKKNDSNAPFKVVLGHGVFVMPIRSRISTINLSMQESQVVEECVSKQGIALMVKAVIAFKVGDDSMSITNAARRFLNDQRSMPIMTGRIFAGHLRSIVGSMSVEEIIRERQRLAEEVLGSSKPEMEKLGLIVDSFQIQSIDDQNSGYIKALGAPQNAAVQRDAAVAQAQAEQQAQIAQANATQAAQVAQAQAQQASQIAQAQAQQKSAEVQQESIRSQADYERQTQVAKASYKAEVDKAQAEAAAAGPLAQAQAQQAVIDQQAELAKKNAELTEQQLVASVTKPADAEAYRISTLAKANAENTRLQAEAMAAGSGVTIQRQLVDQMPAIIGAAASQLSNANITVLNGADGLSEILSGLASQAGSLLNMVRKQLNADEVAVPVGVANQQAVGAGRK